MTGISSVSGRQLALELNLAAGMRFNGRTDLLIEQWRKKHVLILGVNGFIGNHLSERLLESGRYVVHGMDLCSNTVERLLGHEVGLHAWDHHKWQARVERMGQQVLSTEIRRGYDLLTDILGWHRQPIQIQEQAGE